MKEHSIRYVPLRKSYDERYDEELALRDVQHRAADRRILARAGFRVRSGHVDDRRAENGGHCNNYRRGAERLLLLKRKFLRILLNCTILF